MTDTLRSAPGPGEVLATTAGDPSGALTGRVFWNRAAGTLVSKAVIVVLGLVTAVLTARVLGPSGRGVLAVLVTVGTLGVQFGNLGLPSAMTYRVANERSTLRELLGASLLSGLGFGTLIGGTFLAIGLLVPAIAPLESAWLLALAVVWIPLGTLNLLLQNLLLGLHRIRLYNIVQLLNKAGVVALLVLLYLVNRAGVVSFYLASLVVLIGGLSWAFLALLRESGFMIRWPGRRLLAHMARYGLKAYVATLFAYMLLHFDLLMVSAMLSDAETGHYSIAARMAEMIYLAPVAVGGILFATVSAMDSGQWRFTLQTALIMAVVLLVGLGLAGFVARPVVEFLFGAEFLPAVTPFLWLLPGIFALGVNTIFMNYFAGIGMPLIAVVAPGLAAAANIPLNLLLIPVWGISGAAIASTLSYAVMLGSSVVYLAAVRPQ